MKVHASPGIKAHIIVGVFYLFLLGAVGVIPFALGQQNGTRPTEVLGAHVLMPPPAPKFPQVVLYDQYNNAQTHITLSATFTDSPARNSDLADDFVVPAGQTWNVESIDADGAYFNGPGPANSFNVFFYADNAGFPGTQVYSATNESWVQNGSTFTVNLPAPATLSAGTYWVEIQANMTIMCCEWGWTDRTIASNNAAVWQNPSGFFGTCQSWSRRGATCGFDPSAPDQVYRLNGTITGTPTPTPTCTPNELIENGGFETGDFSGWVIDGIHNPPVVTDTRWHSGTFSALIGGDGTPQGHCPSGSEPTGDSSLYQQFTVPDNGGTLSFWHWDCCATDVDLDYQDAYITDSNGNILQTIFHLFDSIRDVAQRDRRYDALCRADRAYQVFSPSGRFRRYHRNVCGRCAAIDHVCVTYTHRYSYANGNSNS